MNNDLPDFEYILTIYIPTYSRAPLLRRTLSLLLPYVNLLNKSRLEKIAVVVSDNASPDETKDIAQAFVYEFYFYHRNHWNIGPLDNFYQSVKLCSSEYIWILGDDDILLNQYLGELLDCINFNRPDLLFLGQGNKYTSHYESISNAETTLEDLFQIYPITSLAHISRLVYRKAILVSCNPLETVVPDFFVWTWIGPAVSYGKSLRCFDFLRPVIYATKEGGMDAWTGKTALARLLEFDEYIGLTCTTSASLSKAYEINYIRDFPLIITVAKSLALHPDKKQDVASFIAKLQKNCPEANPKLWVLRILTTLPKFFLSMIGSLYRKSLRLLN